MADPGNLADCLFVVWAYFDLIQMLMRRKICERVQTWIKDILMKNMMGTEYETRSVTKVTGLASSVSDQQV